MKKFAKIALVALMALCMTLTTVANVGAEEVYEKARFAIVNKDANGDVEAGASVVVNSDYSIDAAIFGETVRADEFHVGVMLNDVASLGVDGMKEKWWTMSTGSALDADLNTWVYSVLEDMKFTVNATVEGKPVAYEFEGKTSETEYTLTGTTDEAKARAAWHELASHLKVSTNAVADSFASVKEGTYVQLGKEKLVVVKDGKLDNITLGQATEEAIKDLVELRTVETAANVIYVPAGTVLCVGDDQVELLCATTITMTGETIDQIFEYGYLSDIRANSDTLEQLLFRLVNFIPDLNQLNGAEIGVNVDFACTNSTVTVDPTCTEDGLETVITSCGKTVSEKVLPATGHTFVNLKCACGVEIKVDADTHEDSISEEEAEKTEVKEVTIVDDHKTDGAVATVKKEATDLVVTLLSDPDAAEELVEAGVISEETATSLIEAVEAGESIEAIISVEKITTVEDKTEANIESAAEKALGSEDVKVTYLDVTVVLTSKTTGTMIGEFHKLSKPITVTVALPEELIVEGAKYVVIRDHEGTVTALATVDNGDGTISFTTDQFSTYAIAYATPKAPETGDSGLAGLYAMLFALSAAALFLLKRQEA